MFDDRLATVLRTSAESAAGERTQFRQLLDLLGTGGQALEDSELAEEAYQRLEVLQNTIPADDQSHILRESGLRLRSAKLLKQLALAQPKIAAAAMATARLAESEWEQILSGLPVTARGFLRHRRDLPAGAVRMLERLGVGDLTLPDPKLDIAAAGEASAIPLAMEEPEEEPLVLAEEIAEPEPMREQEAPPKPAATPPSPPQIGQILERIERYRHGRRAPVLAPRLPLGDAPSTDGAAKILSFDIRTDARGRAIAASDPVAPWITGMLITAVNPGGLVDFSTQTAIAIHHHQPLRAERITLEGPPQINGGWQIDAVPVFTRPRGAFDGYRCRLRRPARKDAPKAAGDSQADRMRQILHELRTPVGAIQGFAEIIQQQMFGAVPHEYRAHAASISVDAARLLAGFDEIDRLAKLESASLKLAEGETDFRKVLDETIARLGAVLSPRDAGFMLSEQGHSFTLAFAPGEAAALAWRILATLAGALGAGQILPLQLSSNGRQLQLECELPESLRDDASRAQPTTRKAAVSAGMFGPHFAFRLASAEAEAADGSLETNNGRLILTLPVLTAAARPHSTAGEQAQG